MTKLTTHVLFFMLFCMVPSAQAAKLKIEKVNAQVYALVGDLTQRNKQNLGNNATFGFVVTGEGVVLMDSGAGEQGAQEIHRLIKTVTSKPIKYVVNLGGQDHRWLGNHYFKRQGATIIASTKAVADQKQRLGQQFTQLSNLVGDQLMKGTKEYFADKTFEHSLDLKVGGVEFQLRHISQAHTPGDSFVWVPKHQVVFAGDIVYVDRLLSLIPVSHSAGWIKAFEAIAALKPKVIVPGHGRVTDLTRARSETYDYLVALRAGMKALHAKGATEESVHTFDQSAYKHSAMYNEIKGGNALRVFIELELE